MHRAAAAGRRCTPGAYQAGVYEALAEAHLAPDWVAGISIGAVNAALIAGNPPTVRVEKLREFWKLITAGGPWDGIARFAMAPSIVRSEFARGLLNQLSAGTAIGRRDGGLLAPRVPSAPGFRSATRAASKRQSYYDTAPLKATLEPAWSTSTAHQCRRGRAFSIGAVNVTTGNFSLLRCPARLHTYIGAEHVMASGALPPAFPAVEIDGEFYWDGGLVSNTPLQWVLESEPRRDTLAFQVDLWSARGTLPRTLPEVMTRQKEIQYSSRTRNNSDRFKSVQRLRNALASLLQKLPDELRNSPELAMSENHTRKPRRTTWSSSSTAPSSTKATPRTTNSRVSAWRTIGARVITTRSGPCAIPRCWSDPTISRAS